MLRRRPVIGAPVAHGASDHLKRSIGTFQLTLFGVGATVGTGIFFVLSAAVPEAARAAIASSSTSSFLRLETCVDSARGGYRLTSRSSSRAQSAISRRASSAS